MLGFASRSGPSGPRAEELRSQIAAAQRYLTEKRSQLEHFDRDIDEANERQRLRRELESVQVEIEGVEDWGNYKRKKRELIDNDLCGDNRPDDVVAPRADGTILGQLHQACLAKSNEAVLSCSEGVAKGEYLWKIEGLSWLVNALAQTGEGYASSDAFFVGGEEFMLVYHPKAGYIGNLGNRRTQEGSLAVRHWGARGITFRYNICIKGSGGDFVQWGKSGDECHPDDNTFGMTFGPDVQVKGGYESDVKAVGVFGLSHKELLQSDWVVGDALTVKCELAVRPACSIMNIAASKIEVPAPTIAENLLSLLDDSRFSDVIFIVDGSILLAHSPILCARSEVFDRLLNGGMREAASKEVVVEDCDFATFKALLQFLYTDDFGSIEDMVKAGCAGIAISSPTESFSNMRMSLLQSVLAVSHKYQVLRLRLWCEQQLCKGITVNDVCSVLCQACLYEAKQLEEECLTFIKRNMEKVVVTSSFGSLGREWPEVMLQIIIFVAGVPETSAAAAIEAQQRAPCSAGGKRKRGE